MRDENLMLTRQIEALKRENLDLTERERHAAISGVSVEADKRKIAELEAQVEQMLLDKAVR